MNNVTPFPGCESESTWIADVREVSEGYAVAFLRHEVVVCRETFATYPEVTAAARIIHLIHDEDVRVLLTPTDGVPA